MFYLVCMSSMSVHELNQHLDEVNARVEEGQHIDITRDGMTIANITAVDIDLTDQSVPVHGVVMASRGICDLSHATGITSNNPGPELTLDDHHGRGR